jgi:hypothetical protein
MANGGQHVILAYGWGGADLAVWPLAGKIEPRGARRLASSLKNSLLLQTESLVFLAKLAKNG